MARGRRKTIAAELLNVVSPPPYKLYVSALNENDALLPENFKHSKWGDYFTVDTSNIVCNGCVNPNHVYDLFGKYNSKTAVEVRMSLLQYIGNNMGFFERRGTVCLKSRGISFPTWIENIGDETVYCDELALLGLCALYNRHCLVVTQNKFWSTLETLNPIGLMTLLQRCNVKLLFLGQLRFGTLNWNPRPPKPKVPKTPALKFSIVEEYTLDDTLPVAEDEWQHLVNSNMNAAASISVPSSSHKDDDFPVETMDVPMPLQIVSGTKTDVEKDLCKPADPCKNNTVSTKSTTELLDSTDNNESHVETDLPVKTEPEDKLTCPEDGLVLSRYPWQKTATIKVQRVSDITVDIWCNSVSNYYQHVPEPDIETTTEVSNLQVKPSIVKGYGSKRPDSVEEPVKVKRERATSPVETDNIQSLLTQAEKLVNKAKSIVTTTKSEKPPTKGRTKGRTSITTEFPVETNSDPLDVLHQKTMNKLAPIGAIPKIPARVRVIHCKMCTETFSTVKDLNRHHREDHGIVGCEQCDKQFTSQSSLDKHVYTHGDLKHVCELCSKKFPFASRLEQHSKVHTTHKLSCPVKSCKKEFKNIGDLNRHEKKHKKGGWFKCTHCDYCNKDKRNTSSHMRTHQKEDEAQFECDKCHKKMRFSTQFRRHREKGCAVTKLTK